MNCIEHLYFIISYCVYFKQTNVYQIIYMFSGLTVSIGGICRPTKNAEISIVNRLSIEPLFAGLLVSFLPVKAYSGSTFGKGSRLGSTMGPIRRGRFALNPGIGSSLLTLNTVLVTCSPCSTMLSGEVGRCCFLHFLGGQ